MTVEGSGTAAAEERALVSLDDLVMDVDAQIRTLVRRVADRYHGSISGPDDDWLAWACSELTVTRQQLAEARAALSGALRPQVLTEDTPEPARPWFVLNADVQFWTHSEADDWAGVLCRFSGRPVYVISGGQR